MFLIRHAPLAVPGVLAGRSDLPARLPDKAGIDAAREVLARLGANTERLVSSPAKRCVTTAEALYPGIKPETDPRLWEQDFGAWDGRPVVEMPDLGPLNRATLAARRPPGIGGESFLDAAARILPAFDDLAAMAGTVTIIAHAGTIRAALGQALGAPKAGLAFEVAPLSVTCLRVFADGSRAIVFVNRDLT